MKHPACAGMQIVFLLGLPKNLVHIISVYIYVYIIYIYIYLPVAILGLKILTPFARQSVMTAAGSKMGLLELFNAAAAAKVVIKRPASSGKSTAAGSTPPASLASSSNPASPSVVGVAKPKAPLVEVAKPKAPLVVVAKPKAPLTVQVPNTKATALLVGVAKPKAPLVEVAKPKAPVDVNAHPKAPVGVVAVPKVPLGVVTKPKAPSARKHNAEVPLSDADTSDGAGYARPGADPAPPAVPAKSSAVVRGGVGKRPVSSKASPATTPAMADSASDVEPAAKKQKLDLTNALAELAKKYGMTPEQLHSLEVAASPTGTDDAADDGITDDGFGLPADDDYCEDTCEGAECAEEEVPKEHDVVQSSDDDGDDGLQMCNGENGDLVEETYMDEKDDLAGDPPLANEKVDLAKPDLAKAASEAQSKAEIAAAEDGATMEGKLPNSSTHRTEYMKFLRQGQNQSQWPSDMTKQYCDKDGKTELFRLWLDSDQAMSKVVMKVKKGITKSKRASNLFGWRHRSVFDERYGAEKAQVIIDRKIEAKQWCWDPELPDDKAARLYLMRLDTTLDVSTNEFEEMAAEAETELDTDMANALLGKGGILGGDSSAASLPMLQDGADAFMGMIGSAAAPKAKAKGKKDPSTTPTTVVLQPASVREAIEQKLPDILTQAGNAQNWAIKLKPFKISSDLVEQLENHCKFMRKAYKVLQAMVLNKVDVAEKYADLVSKVDKAMKWYEARDKAAKSLNKAVNPGVPKVKAKAKA
jgi:hypothetical protein